MIKENNYKDNNIDHIHLDNSGKKSFFDRFFSESPITWFLISSLIFMFIVEVFFILPNKELMELLMNHPNGSFVGNLTSIFLHGSLFHLLSNCVALFVFGRQVEKHIKGFKLILIFLLGGVLANIISNLILISTNAEFYFSLGASGAIASLIILAIVLKPFSFTNIFIVPIPIFLLGWVLIIMDVVGLTNPSQTNHLAHIGGYFSLFLLTIFFNKKDRKKVFIGIILNIVMLVVLYFILGYFNINTTFDFGNLI